MWQGKERTQSCLAPAHGSFPPLAVVHSCWQPGYPWGSADGLYMAYFSFLLSACLPAFASNAHREGNRGSTPQVVLLRSLALPSPVSASAPAE